MEDSCQVFTPTPEGRGEFSIAVRRRVVTATGLMGVPDSSGRSVQDLRTPWLVRWVHETQTWLHRHRHPQHGLFSRVRPTPRHTERRRNATDAQLDDGVTLRRCRNHPRLRSHVRATPGRTPHRPSVRQGLSRSGDAAYAALVEAAHTGHVKPWNAHRASDHALGSHHALRAVSGSLLLTGAAQQR